MKDIAITVRHVCRFPQVAPDPLLPPSNPATPTITSDSVVLTFSPSPSQGILGYRVWITVGGTRTLWGTTPSTSITFPGLLPETPYTFEVRAYNDTQESTAITIGATTLALATPKSTIRMTQTTYTAVEGTTVNVGVTRSGGDNTSEETIDVTEQDNTAGSDYTITWPGGVSGEVTFPANVTTVSIAVAASTDSETEAGESVTFVVEPSLTSDWTVGTPSSSTVNIIDPPTSTYGDSVMEFTALEGATSTQIRSVVEIDPAAPGSLPVFEIVSDATHTADVFPLTYTHNGLVDKVLVTGLAEHPAYTGANIYQRTCTLRHNESATPPGSNYYRSDDISALRFEVRDVPTHGTIEVDPFDTLLAEREGKYTLEQLYYVRVNPDGEEESFGFTTQVIWRSDIDMIEVTVVQRNDAYDPDFATGHQVAHDETAGDVYFKSMGVKSGTLNASWTMEHHHNNTTNQGGLDFVKDEGGFQPIPARVRFMKRFYFRRGNETVARARAAFAGAGLAQVVSGSLAVGKRMSALGHGLAIGRHPDQAALRAQLSDQWDLTLGRIQTGTRGGANWSDFAWNLRYGWCHTAGPADFRQGGGWYLHHAIGFSNEIHELNILRKVVEHQLPRHCTSLTNYSTGAIIWPSDMAAYDGTYPFLEAPDDSNYEQSNWHFRGDPSTTRGAGAIVANPTHPNVPTQSKTLLPTGRDWGAPGGGATIVGDESQWPMRFSAVQFDAQEGQPHNGTHSRRWMCYIDGMIQMAGELIHVHLAQEEAAHVMRCLANYPLNSNTVPDVWEWNRYEYNLVDGVLDLAGGPPALLHWGAWGSVGYQDVPDERLPNPAMVHRLMGELADCVAIGAATIPNGAIKDEMRVWAHKFMVLVDLRTSPVGWGRRSHDTQDVDGGAFIATQWGDRDDANQEGAWPDHFVANKAFFQMFAAMGLAGLERRLRPRGNYPSGQDVPHRRAIVDTYMENWNRAMARGRKQQPKFGLIVSHENVPGAEPYQSQPHGPVLNGVGTGTSPVNWLERHRKPSEVRDGSFIDYITTTIRDETCPWIASVVSMYELGVGVNNLPVLDLARQAMEGIASEDDGAYHLMSYAEAAEQCFSGYSYVGGNTVVADNYWANFYLYRRWAIAGLLQNADHWLSLYPSWGEGDPPNRLDPPDNAIFRDEPTGVRVTWDAVPGAFQYRIEWGELHPVNGVMEGFIDVSGTTGTVTGLPDGIFFYFRVSAINEDGVQCTSTRLAHLQIGSGATATPSTSGGGGGGNTPGTPTIDSLTWTTGGFQIVFTDPGTGTQPLVARVYFATSEANLLDADERGERYIYLSGLPRTDNTYTANVTGLPEELHYVNMQLRDANASDSALSAISTVDPDASPGGGGGGSGGEVGGDVPFPGGEPQSGVGPLNLVVVATSGGANMSWAADGSASGYETSYSADRTEFVVQNTLPGSTTSDVYTGVGAGLKWYTVRSVYPDGSRSNWSEPWWVVSPSDEGVNPFIKPVERAQGVTYDASLGHVGPSIDDADLVLADASWKSGNEYVFDSTFTEWPIVGRLFDSKVEIQDDSTHARFIDCKFTAGGQGEGQWPYSIEVDNSSGGADARIDLTRCRIQHGNKSMIWRGGQIIDCIIESPVEDGVFNDYLHHDTIVRHNLFQRIGDEETDTTEEPHSDALQVKGTYETDGTTPHSLLIEGNWFDVYSSGDPSKPANVINNNSSIIMEAAKTKIGHSTKFVTVQNNWIGSGNNNLQIKNDTSTPQGVPSHVFCYGNIISPIFNNADVDVVVTDGEAYGNTLTDGTNVDGDF